MLLLLILVFLDFINNKLLNIYLYKELNNLLNKIVIKLEEKTSSVG